MCAMRGKRLKIATLEYRSAMKRSEGLTPATTWMALQHMKLSERRQTQKATVCDSIYVTCPEQGNPQKQEVG